MISWIITIRAVSWVNKGSQTVFKKGSLNQKQSHGSAPGSGGG